MHISLCVKNIYQTADFYSILFGQNPDKIKPDYCILTPETPSQIISFIQNEEKVANQFSHLGFQIESMEELTKRLNDCNLQNIDVIEEMGANCCYANLDKFWISDPDGYMWKTYVLNNDLEWNDWRYQKDTNDIACCAPEITSEEKQKVQLSESQNNSCSPESRCY